MSGTKYFAAAFLVGTVILTGAGCTNNLPATKTTDSNTSTTEKLTVDSNAINTSTPVNTSELSLVAETTGKNTVKFSWTVPTGMDTTYGFRILNSAKAEPVIPGAFWGWANGKTTEATLKDIKSGKRYVRVCQWIKGGKCGVYSNIVELQVK